MKTRWNSYCTQCLLKKHLTNYPDTATEEERLTYIRRLFSILTDIAPGESSPVIVNRYQEAFQSAYAGTGRLDLC